jgi:hypothetical protein
LPRCTFATMKTKITKVARPVKPSRRPIWVTPELCNRVQGYSKSHGYESAAILVSELLDEREKSDRAKAKAERAGHREAA